MLIHPDTDDPGRLLLAAQSLAAWFYLDDHYCDDERSGAVPALVGPRLTLALLALDPAHLVGRYASELKRFLTGLQAWIAGSREWHSSSGRYRVETHQC